MRLRCVLAVVLLVISSVLYVMLTALSSVICGIVLVAVCVVVCVLGIQPTDVLVPDGAINHHPSPSVGIIVKKGRWPPACKTQQWWTQQWTSGEKKAGVKFLQQAI